MRTMVLEYLPTKVGDLCWANVGKYFKDVQRCSKCLISLAQIDQINSCDSWDLGEDSSITFYSYYPSPNKGATFQQNVAQHDDVLGTCKAPRSLESGDLGCRRATTTKVTP